jgi:hypothetical protein
MALKRDVVTGKMNGRSQPERAMLAASDKIASTALVRLPSMILATFAVSALEEVQGAFDNPHDSIGRNGSRA